MDIYVKFTELWGETAFHLFRSGTPLIYKDFSIKELMKDGKIPPCQQELVGPGDKELAPRSRLSLVRMRRGVGGGVT